MINIEKRNKVSDITAIGLMVALLCISSYIAFPIPFTPIMITSQTIIINLIALTMSTKNGMLSIIVFYLIGAIGLPVFSGGKSGIGTLVGPSGGYFLGFLLAVLIITLIRGKALDLKKSIMLTVLVGMVIIYICGATWMGYYNGLSFVENVKVSIIPFILGDLIKCVLASFIAIRINKIYGC